MSRWLSSVLATVILFGVCPILQAYEDGDLLCRPEWSPALLQQQLWQQYEEQRVMAAQYQYAMTYGAAAEQRRLEMIRSARRAKLEKAAQRKAQIIATRKAASNVVMTAKP